MDVLVACEFSAVVRDAFREAGFNAYSVDLLPTEGDPEFHIVGDALEVARRPGWHLVIAHPPCTRLTRAGVRWLHERDLWADMRRDAEFFRAFLDLDVPYIAVENPVMHRYASEIVGRKQDQIIQPWMFGHRESKGTGLWLKGLPPLVATDDVKTETMALTPKERDRVHWMAPGPNRWKERSRTYAGIAQAMADQWGRYLKELTLNSQDGKVGFNSNGGEAEMTNKKQHTGSTVVALIERVWDRLRTEHPELPAVVVTTGSGEGVKWGHFRPESWRHTDDGTKLHEFFLSSEALAKGATQVLQTTIHEAAHTLSKVRGNNDTSRQGRWHNATFRKTAEELGLEHKAGQADKTHGFAFVTLTEATKTKYESVLADLERELKLTGLLPFWLGGERDEDDRGGERMTAKPKDEDGEAKPKSGNLKATCLCVEPVIIRLSQKVLDLDVVRCDACTGLFRVAD